MYLITFQSGMGAMFEAKKCRYYNIYGNALNDLINMFSAASTVPTSNITREITFFLHT